MTLYEGRNRQIRKMMEALNYNVLKLHRVTFGGIALRPLDGPGDWEYLDEVEMGIVRTVLAQAKSDQATEDETMDEE